MTYQARVTEAGHVILPDELAEELGLRPGGALEIERDGDKLILKSYQQVVRGAQAKFRAMLPSDYRGSLADELIAERRREARRDNDEHEAWLRSKTAE